MKEDKIPKETKIKVMENILFSISKNLKIIPKITA